MGVVLHVLLRSQWLLGCLIAECTAEWIYIQVDVLLAESDLWCM